MNTQLPQTAVVRPYQVRLAISDTDVKTVIQAALANDDKVNLNPMKMVFLVVTDTMPAEQPLKPTIVIADSHQQIDSLERSLKRADIRNVVVLTCGDAIKAIESKAHYYNRHVPQRTPQKQVAMAA